MEDQGRVAAKLWAQVGLFEISVSLSGLPDPDRVYCALTQRSYEGRPCAKLIMQRMAERIGETGKMFDSKKRHGLLEFPTVSNPLGNLTYCESDQHIPFQIARTYFVYDIPDGSQRGGHAHRDQESVIFSMHGRFRVTVHDGIESCSYMLDNPQQGLYMGRMIWREIDAYSSEAVSCILSSGYYEEADYIRDWAMFLSQAGLGYQ